jgi:hypothetical protein
MTITIARIRIETADRVDIVQSLACHVPALFRSPVGSIEAITGRKFGDYYI